MAVASTATTAPSAPGGTASGVSTSLTWPGPSMTTWRTEPPYSSVDTISMLCTVTHQAGGPPPRRERAHDMRNPHAGEPFDTSDEDIAAALQDVSIPTLMLSLVHMTGDPELIRGRLKPAGLFLNEVQGFMTEEDKAEVRDMALGIIRHFRDRGCPEPEPISAELLHEMMGWLVFEEGTGEDVPLLLEEMELDGSD